MPTISSANLCQMASMSLRGRWRMVNVTLPQGGTLGWGYTNFTYVGSRTQPEVNFRSVYDGVTTHTYVMGWDPADANLPVHHWADWYAGMGDKEWIFNTSGPYLGLVAIYYAKTDPSYAILHEVDYTWTADAAGNPYIAAAVTTNDPGTVNAVQKKVTQTLDSHGNMTQMQTYNWGAGAPGSLLRTYTNTYLTNSNYASRYIFNRLLTSTVSDGTNNITLASNTYDYYGPCVSTGLSGPGNPALHDAAYSSAFIYRGNVTQSTTPEGGSCRAFDILGNVVAAQDPAGRIYTTNINGSTNYAAPSAITTNSLTENLSWSSFLGLTSETGPNGDTSGTVYDAYARPASTTSPHGAVTSYSYTSNTTTATVNGRWTKTTVDGFGRPLLVETGYGSTTVSQVDYVYGACGCSPIGKLMQKSQPHAPNATKHWTTYTYDGIGRTIGVQAADGASTTGYAYWGNVVMVVDAGGHWKHMVQDAAGNLVLVREPNPAYPGDDNQDIWTSYAYDVLNHLTNVWISGPSGTQSRTFTYSGAYLMSKNEPETGTTNYTYSGGLLQTKVDAKNQKTQYSYDSYGRVTMIQHYPVSTGSEDLCQRVTLYYDTNPFNGGYSQYALGRQTAVQYRGAGCGDITPSTENPVNPNTFVEMYSYTQGGLMAGNELLISQTAYQPPGYTSPVVTADLEATYTYDNEGKMTGMHYPSSGSGGFQGDTYAYSFDSMARPTGLTDQTNAHTAVSGVTYGPAGEMLTIGYGLQGSNWFSETRTYNTLLQVTAISATNSNTGAQFGRQYSYSATQNNGKIQSETDTISGEQVTYQYDALNRLLEALSNSASAPWGQKFTYDQFGNLTDKDVISGSAPTYHTAFSAATNRDNNVSYDANGNQTAVPGLQWVAYDIENRMVQAHALGVEDDYAYGRGNRRVYAAHWQYDGTKFNLTSEKIYFYSVTGQKLATYQLSLNDPQPGTPSLILTALDTRVWFGSRLVTLNGLPVVPDRLGSFGKYYPYGEERGTGNPPGDQEKFATYTRDSATGLDYAVNRYYNNVSGRFLSADPWRDSMDLTTPTSLNRYAYVWGDPMNNNDPSGLCIISSKEYPDGRPPCPSDTSANVTDTADPVPIARPTRPAPTPIQEAYVFAESLRQVVMTLSGYNPCYALAEFADGLSDSAITVNQFVKDFGILVPSQFESKIGLLYYNSNPVYLWSAGPSGYAADFQNTVDDSPSGNGDQGHHFAAFFEYGYLHPNASGEALATAFEWAESLFGIRGPVNQGDINLGIQAFNIGASLQKGTIKVSDVGQKIRELCAK